MTPKHFILLFCLLWLVVCWRIWFRIGKEHAWQRHFIAVGAGAGAALFYLLGTLIWAAVKPPPAPPPPSSEAVRIVPLPRER